jgi:hypothetical protein
MMGTFVWVLSSGSYDGARGMPIGAPNDGACTNVADGNGGRPEYVAGGPADAFVGGLDAVDCI